jgi:hypothetical protein
VSAALTLAGLDLGALIALVLACVLVRRRCSR